MKVGSTTYLTIKGFTASVDLRWTDTTPEGSGVEQTPNQQLHHLGACREVVVCLALEALVEVL